MFLARISEFIYTSTEIISGTAIRKFLEQKDRWKVRFMTPGKRTENYPFHLTVQYNPRHSALLIDLLQNNLSHLGILKCLYKNPITFLSLYLKSFFEKYLPNIWTMFFTPCKLILYIMKIAQARLSILCSGLLILRKLIGILIDKSLYPRRINMRLDIVRIKVCDTIFSIHNQNIMAHYWWFVSWCKNVNHIELILCTTVFSYRQLIC